MSNLLLEYEKSYKKIEEKINNNFNKLNLSLGVDSDIDKSKLLKEVELLILEQEKILKQMEFDTSIMLSTEDYEIFITKMKTYKKNLQFNKNSYVKLEEKISIKNTLSNNTDQNISKGLLNNEQVNYISNLKLQEARRILSNTEDMGNKIVHNMDDQTKEMKNINIKVKDMNNDQDESNNILNIMKSRMKKNKRIIILLTIIFLIILIIVIGYKFVKK